MKKLLIILLLATLLAATASFTYAQTYQEVKTFTGSGTTNTNTENFNIPSGEWRVTWSYTPNSSYPLVAFFSVYVYPKDQIVSYIDSVAKDGDNETSGIIYIHEGNQEYYLKIATAYLQDYTVTVEAETNAAASPTVPEFPTATLAVCILLAVSVSIIFVARKNIT
jgi:hypothetical protein